jgi:threonine/homoserine/homoserine lactone efflux protein
MPIETLLTLTGLVLAAAWTPGPNNALLAASGANFGLRRTLPHIAGIILGFPLMVLLVGVFLGQVFQASLLLREALRWLGAGLLLWIAWKVATSGGLGRPGRAPRPMTFAEAAGFQWVNPKGWAMAIAVPAQFIAPAAPVATALIVTAVFMAVNTTSAFGWAAIGQALTRVLTTPGRLKWFNRTMAALIAACVVLLFLD